MTWWNILNFQQENTSSLVIHGRFSSPVTLVFKGGYKRCPSPCFFCVFFFGIANFHSWKHWNDGRNPYGFYIPLFTRFHKMQVVRRMSEPQYVRLLRPFSCERSKQLRTWKGFIWDFCSCTKNIPFLREISFLKLTYGWRKKSCTSWYGKYPIIYKVLWMPGGAGFLPSWLEDFLFGKTYFPGPC